MSKKIAIQGILGSYHHQAAVEYYGNDIKLIECLSFDELGRSLAGGQCQEAVMAIENSIAGAIIPNYAIIDEHHFSICGEHYVKIEHCLLALQNQQLSEIQEVYSHPMALLQCKDFLKKYPHIKRIETADTAAEAQRIHQSQILNIAAIASKESATIYHLDILENNIQTIQNNTTRFVILKRKTTMMDTQKINKASLKFILDHKQGSLATTLNILNQYDLNMTKIQSLPVIKKPWKYAFFIDVLFTKYSSFEKAKNILVQMVEEFKILGEYTSTVDGSENLKNQI